MKYTICFLILFFGFSLQSYAQTELEKKAGYINRFIRNISWPSSAVGSEFIIGVIGDAKVAKVIEDVLGNRSAKSKTIKVKHFKHESEMEVCPVVFVSKTSSLYMSNIEGRYIGKPTLLITEKKGFLDRGKKSIGINFDKINNDVIYELNEKLLEELNLRIESRLVKGASYVIPAPEKENLTASNERDDKPVDKRKIEEYKEELTNRLNEQIDLINRMDISNEEKDKLLKELKNQKNVFEAQRNVLEERRKREEERAKKREAEKEALRKEQKIQEITQRNRVILLSIIAATLLLLLGVFFVFYRRRKNTIKELQQVRNDLSNKIAEINQQKELLEQSASIMDKKNKSIRENRDELARKSQELEYQNKKITDSIRYALTIQKAMLPSQQILDEYFNENFVLYIPKDIVSGDFYWTTRIGDKSFVAVVDCTGHGVPGAFMSTIGTDLLNEIVNERRIFDPARILEMLHLGIFERLRQKDSNNKDGMDVCLCVVSPQKDGSKKVLFSGAKRPLYYSKDNELYRIAGDAKYVGGLRRDNEGFTNKTLNLKKGEMLYLTTDGYVDTPNTNRKRFGGKRFKKLLSDLKYQPIEVQEELIRKTIEDHKEEADYRDDVTILGIKL